MTTFRFRVTVNRSYKCFYKISHIHKTRNQVHTSNKSDVVNVRNFQSLVGHSVYKVKRIIILLRLKVINDSLTYILLIIWPEFVVNSFNHSFPKKERTKNTYITR